MMCRPDASGLTARQFDVLRLLMRGEPNKAIARQLGLTEGTVKIHIAAILRGLQSRNRTEAVVTARRLGIENRRRPAYAGRHRPTTPNARRARGDVCLP